MDECVQERLSAVEGNLRVPGREGRKKRQKKAEKKKQSVTGRLGGSVDSASGFGSGHDLAVHGLEPHIGLCADSSEPGACFGFCLPLSLCLPCSCSVSKINKTLKKKE